MITLPLSPLRAAAKAASCSLKWKRWVIAGLTYKSTAQGFIRVPADFVISRDEVRKIIQDLQDQRQHEAQTKRGWRG